MVASQKTTVSSLENGWQQHISGVSGSVPPLAPAKLTGSLWAVGNSPIANCTNFSASDQNTAANFVENVPPNGAGTSNGMLGYMFWEEAARVTARCVRIRQILAKAEWESALRRLTFRNQ